MKKHKYQQKIKGAIKMKRNELLWNIYNETRSVNRNLQRLHTVILCAVLGVIGKKCAESGDELGKNIAKAGILTLAAAQILMGIDDLCQLWNALAEKRLDNKE